MFLQEVMLWKLIPYIQEETSKGVQLNHIMRHTVGLLMDKTVLKHGNNIFLKYASEMLIFKK